MTRSRSFLMTFGLAVALGLSPAPAALPPASASPAAPGAPAPLDFGVVYPVPGSGVTDDEIARDLQRVQDHGFDHVNLSSWIWTLPGAGTPMRHRVDVLLDWCDRHGMGVWLLQNVQYGTGEGGDFERTVTDPVEYVRPYVANWIAALKGHRCVRGVILGNEVGPALPADLGKTPHYWQAFVAWLQAKYPTVAALNETWGTQYETFGQVTAPAEGTPGWVDYHHFAQTQFGRFYSQVFEALFKPSLGASLGYASKTSPDPFLYRRYPGATVLCWDDLVANYPVWAEKVLTDCDPRPAFNSEMHLYSDNYAYYPSVELTRYRYYVDALSGERSNSSFDWGSWKKPEIAAIDGATPAALAEVHRLWPYLAALAGAQRRARVGVVVSEPVFQGSSAALADRPVLPVSLPGQSVSAGPAPGADVPPLEAAYAAMAGTGQPWRFVLDADLPGEAKGLNAVLVPGYARYPLSTIEAITALPKRVQVEWAGPWPSSDEYGHLLPPSALRALQSRCRHWDDMAQAAQRYAGPRPLPPACAPADGVYGWWSPRRGSYSFPVRYPRVEIRRARTPSGREIVALINHTHDVIPFPLTALSDGPRPVPMLDAAQGIPVDGAKPLLLKPFDVRVLLLPRVSASPPAPKRVNSRGTAYKKRY